MCTVISGVLDQIKKLLVMIVFGSPLKKKMAEESWLVVQENLCGYVLIYRTSDLGSDILTLLGYFHVI